MQSLDGTMWRLIEASAFDDDGRELSPPLGKHPMGFIMSRPNGSWLLWSMVVRHPRRMFRRGRSSLTAASIALMELNLSPTLIAHPVLVWLGSKSVIYALRTPRAWS